MTYEIRIDWRDVTGKVHVMEMIDPRFNVMARTFTDQKEARERVRYFAMNGFWREGGWFVAPASILGGQVKRVAAEKPVTKGGRRR